MRNSMKISALGVLGVLVACAAPIQMTTGPAVLGADGQVKVAEEPNGNTEVTIAIRHLADPQVVEKGATTYVAWIDPPEAPVQNVGQIQLNEDQEGRLETVTPYKEFTVFVTPEQVPTAVEPTGSPVLKTRILGRE